MTTNSYPAVGEGGLTDDQWSRMYAGDDGICEDYTGKACDVSFNNTDNTATVAIGLVRINGYTLEITAPHALSLPAISSGTKTYLIAAQYDPALNIADGSSNRSALGPCRLVVADTALDTSGGKQYVLLYTVTRSASTVLSASVVVDYRRWVGPVVVMPDWVGQPTGFGPFPRGTLLIQTGVNGTSVVDISARLPNAGATALEWQSLTAPAAQPFPLAGGGILVAAATAAPPVMQRDGFGLVSLLGTIRRNSGKLGTGANVGLGTLPVGWRPAQARRYLVFGSGSSAMTGNVTIGTDGAVVLNTGGEQASIDYIHLDGITFRAEF